MAQQQHHSAHAMGIPAAKKWSGPPVHECSHHVLQRPHVREVPWLLQDPQTVCWAAAAILLLTR